MKQEHDVIVLGGGLSGLTLSLQLRQRFPDLDILILERRTHPVPEAAFKIGESSVEIGAHYFANVLGLKDHLEQHQLKKFGFRFFFSDGERDITRVTELGASTFLPTPAYQIDRGRFENALAEIARARGVQFREGALVRRIELSDGATPHDVTYEHEGASRQARSRWLVDASGRAGMLKRQLELAESNDHNANAVWFRIAEQIDINDWSTDTAWLARCDPPNRWLSTNHLMGAGYWVWLIPLSSGSHSIGIVADASLHPLDSMNTFDKSMAWLQKHQPRLFDALDGKRDKLQDFAFFKRFSYGCKKVFSGRQRWALTGEAGLFADPFYSPGSDFIAISNTYVTELIAQDRAGGPTEMYAGIYEQIYFSLYRNMLSLYVDQYPIFGDAEVMPAKVIWDYTYYWGVMCQLFFQQRLTDVVQMGRMQKTLANVQELNVAVQAFLRAWSAAAEPHNPARMLDQARLEWFADLNRGLTDQLDRESFDRRIETMLARLDDLAVEIVARATRACPTLDGTAVMSRVSGGRKPRTKSLLFENMA